MLRILIWQVSNDTHFKDFALQILEYQHDGLEIVGEALNDDITKVDGGGYEILVVGAKKIGMSTVTENARRLNLPEEKLLGDWIVTIPGFTLEKYRKLQRSRLSIISINCFGGFISNQLALPFRSPFVNLYVGNEDFIKFLYAPHFYLEKSLVYREKRPTNQKTQKEFPVVACGDILINMLHYKTFEESVVAWERRKTRINWYNLFVTMWDTDEKHLEQFDALPYGKKACFVPFKSDLDSAWYINPNTSTSHRFVDTYNGFGNGAKFYYDVFDMLLYGKKTPLIEM